MADNRWSLPNSPPPPLFLGRKERNYVKQLNDEINERVVGQTVIYYPIDLNTTNFHVLYGEAINKTFLPPVRIYALVAWDGEETSTDISVLDKVAKITINFHRRRLTEDQDLFVREGDFVLYAARFWEITKLTEPRLLFGQQEHKFEIKADCLRARDGLFPEPDILGEIQQFIIDSENNGGVNQQQMQQALNAYDIVIVGGTDAAFLDMVANPAAYTGRIIYLATLNPSPVAPFFQAGKFYFNENGVWSPSSILVQF